jgi:hypothetical protein
LEVTTMKQLYLFSTMLSAIFFAAIFGITIGGCAASNVATLPSDNASTGMSAQPGTAGTQGTAENEGSTNPGRQLWGVWEISIDPESGDVEVVPARFSEFHANVRKFLEDGPCKNCIKVVPPIVHQPYGIDVTISLTHPFPGNTNFNGFDVRGICMLDGEYLLPTPEYLTTRLLPGNAALRNPDGFTTAFNAPYFTLPGILGYSPGKMVPPSSLYPFDTLNAFKAFYSVGQSEDEGGRRGFQAGDTITRTYEIQVSTIMPFHFYYAVDASWEPPTGPAPYDFDDFPPSANCPEAYRFDFSVVSGELFPDTGSVLVGVDAWDHQGWVAPYELMIQAPECLNTGFTLNTLPIWSIGEKAHWEFTINNDLGFLNPDTGIELAVTFNNPNETDPYNGPIHGVGRFTIPVSPASGGCNNTIHQNYLGTGDFSGGTHMPALDACFIHSTGHDVDGDFMGYISGFAGTVCQTYNIDTTTPTNGHNLTGSNWGNPHITSWPTPNSIDISEELGQFFIAWSDTPGIVEVWQDGIGKLEGETDASEGGRVEGLDTDGHGGFWDVYYPYIGFSDGIKHFVPGTVPGTLTEDVSFLIGEAWGTPMEVICIPDQVLLVLTGLDKGKIRAYSLATDPPSVIMDKSGIFSEDLDFGTFPDKSCDMVADWSDPSLAHCRIIVYGNLASGGGELVKIDTDLNILAGPVKVAGHYQAIDINPKTLNVTLWPEIKGSPGGYALVEVPSGW